MYCPPSPPHLRHRESLACVARAAPRLEALLESADMDADLAAFCDTAAHSVAAGEALAARQAGLLAGVRRELAASPEVLRAGAMEAWDAARGVWVPDRFVLTRAGFLHRLARSPGGDPEVGMALGPPTPALAESVALARCAFEQGDGFKGWQLHTRGGGGGRRAHAVWSREGQLSATPAAGAAHVNMGVTGCTLSPISSSRPLQARPPCSGWWRPRPAAWPGACSWRPARARAPSARLPWRSAWTGPSPCGRCWPRARAETSAEQLLELKAFPPARSLMGLRSRLRIGPLLQPMALPEHSRLGTACPSSALHLEEQQV